MTRNLILTVAANYSLTEMEPFICSWQEHAKSAELIVFTANCTSSLHEACARLGIQTVKVAEGWEFSLLMDRHFLYKSFLEAHRTQYDNVLLTDARDVVFQLDPFAVPRDTDVWFAAEDELIGNCGFNRYWMVNVYGLEVANELGGEVIACAGTTIGTLDGVLRYLDLMRIEADAHPYGVGTFGDQASHNYILYKVKRDYIALDRNDRVVQTLNHTSRARLTSCNGEILIDGVAAPLIHQWDRHPELVQFIGERYRLAQALVG